ncbi:alpha/beta fold hydrolase [Lichenicoccus sp.]|uniref:alpha/beta fold hydrolase n=1 Tax=Lichenicoccus sp. TaxID=2781899 RepID=UPI003D14DBEE
MNVVTGAIRTRVLTSGPLAFTVREAGEGPLVLMIHGFPDEPATFDAQLLALASAGFHVVAPTLRGYEPSSRPSDGSYHLVALAGDVTGWMDALGAERAHLVGHDWGATVAYGAAVGAPDRVLSLAMIAIPPPKGLFEGIRHSPRQLWRSRYMAFLQLKGLSEWWLRRNQAAGLLRLWRRWSPGWSPSPKRLDSLRRRFSDPTVVHAAFSYYRQILDTKTPAGRASAGLIAGAVKMPVLGLCGRDDGCFSADLFVAAMSPVAFPSGVVCKTIADAGHFVHAERPEVVSEHLRSWLAQNS